MIAALALLALPMAAQAVTTHTIVVGGPGVLAFNPPSINAEVGDIMHFVFHQKNHTVTQSSFASPCTPFKDPTTGEAGFNSGFQPVPDSMTDGFPTCDWEVKTDKPLWAYCAQTMPAPHCGKGMVFSVNAPTTGNTFQAFQSAANATAGSTGTDPYGGGYGGSAPSAPSPTDSAPVPSGTSTPPATGSGTVHNVKVGENGLTYDPPRLDAVPGDKVVFTFYPKNHTVTQSSFADPCTKLQAPMAGLTQVLDSGYQPVAAGAQGSTYSIDITTTSPMWFYCQQGNGAHCAQGMVFAINSVESGANNYGAFLAKAQSTSANAGSSNGNSTSTNGVGRAAAVSSISSLSAFAAFLAFFL